MTDLQTKQSRGARERLALSARELVYEQGVERTTLAQVADAAEVPVGNVYYYFKTKDELVEAAIDVLYDELRGILDKAARHRSPRARLKGLVRALAAHTDAVAHRGCPIGTLCSELDKREDRLARRSAELLSQLVEWTEGQFREMGRRDARELAVALIASYEGAALLSNSFGDPELMGREARRLERWIDGLD
ncbi:MAG TPA: TetR/AcrR family transcriptional regulator [Solirubrobacterales bacterium]|jgi:AcrR family transcriptional regulator|nr:TetR/AcrR family transcriptional regulator [Solirubrobacterales bacterium]